MLSAISAGVTVERSWFDRAAVRTLAIVGLACLILPGLARAQSYVKGWGAGVFDSRWNDQSYVEIAAGFGHTVGRLSDGSVVAWGPNNHGECNVPTLPAGLTYVEVAAGQYHTVARRSDGPVVAWGSNGSGQCNVPALPPGLTYVEIAGGWNHTVARRSNGSVVAWGNNTDGRCTVPALPTGLTYAVVAAAGASSIPVAIYGLAASEVSVGTGCGGVGMPVFSCNAPRIGHDLTLSLTQGTPNTSGSIYYSGFPAAPTVIASCIVELDLATFAPLLPVAADPAGAWTLTLGMPPDPSLVGLNVALQIALIPTAGPLGLDLSNGLIVTVGY